MDVGQLGTRLRIDAVQSKVDAQTADAHLTIRTDHDRIRTQVSMCLTLRTHRREVAGYLQSEGRRFDRRHGQIASGDQELAERGGIYPFRDDHQKSARTIFHDIQDGNGSSIKNSRRCLGSIPKFLGAMIGQRK
jgi:hypothetical protein